MGKSESERRREFVEAVDGLCRAVGGVPLPSQRIPTWEVATHAGTLHVSPVDQSKAPWIACRFLEPQRVVICEEEVNFENGKWDFHLWAEWARSGQPEWEPAYSRGLRHFEARLRAVL